MNSLPKETIIVEVFNLTVEYERVTHRIRRGKLVEIPPEWRGKVPHKQTIRKRKSKKNQGAHYKCKAQR